MAILLMASGYKKKLRNEGCQPKITRDGEKEKNEQYFYAKKKIYDLHVEKEMRCIKQFKHMKITLTIKHNKSLKVHQKNPEIKRI